VGVKVVFDVVVIRRKVARRLQKMAREDGQDVSGMIEWMLNFCGRDYACGVPVWFEKRVYQELGKRAVEKNMTRAMVVKELLKGLKKGG
jgi:hypothetical protein